MMPIRLRSVALVLVVASIAYLSAATLLGRGASAVEDSGKQLQIQYLEIVTPAMDETCALLTKMHGVSFGDPQPALGNARTAKLKDGGRIAVRKPMHGGEEPVVRPYVLVDDVDASFEQAKAAGAQVMVPPMASEDGARICIFMHGGIQHGIWQK